MRKSPLRHPVSVLRAEADLLQKELAALVDRSPRTLQSIELLKAPLSMGLAEAISRQTGVHPQWLLNGDPDVPPYDIYGAPFSRATFELAQANIEFGNLERLQVSSLAKRFAQLLREAVNAPDAELRLREFNKALRVLEGTADSYNFLEP